VIPPFFYVADHIAQRSRLGAITAAAMRLMIALSGVAIINIQGDSGEYSVALWARDFRFVLYLRFGPCGLRS